MNTILYYFLQVILCSAIMYAYYLLALRNKKFHQYNRYYLLFTAVFAWIIPFIKIDITATKAAPAPVINFLNIVASNNSEVENIVTQKRFVFNWDILLSASYLTVSAVLLFIFIAALIKIYKLLKTNSARQFNNVYLISTNDQTTPFSFFKYIFWNNAIDLQCNEGKQMLQHELTHVTEKHSIDKIIMQVVIIAGWANPVFWIIRKELSMIHEFIADRKAVTDGDATTLASMLLYAAYPKQHYLLTNPFFFSPIKRRIMMMTKNTNPRFSYVRRLIVLPLLAVVVMLFAFRKKEVFAPVDLEKTYTVIIDAGHGGTDKGAAALDGTTEAAINLAFAKAVQAANTNKHINIVLTRNDDKTQSVKEKASIAQEKKADLFISLHANTADNNAATSGIEIALPKKDNSAYSAESATLAMLLGDLLSKEDKPVKIATKQTGIWVLQQSGCPSILVECGYMSNKTDLLRLKSGEYQNNVAKNIVKSIEQYFEMKENGKLEATVNDLKNVDELSGTIATTNATTVKGYKLNNNDNVVTGKKLTAAKAGEDLKEVTVTGYATKSDKSMDEVVVTGYPTNKSMDEVVVTGYATKKAATTNEPLTVKGKQISMTESAIFLNGKKISKAELENLPPVKIASVTNLKADEAVKKYGADGKNGAIDITTKD